ncbi:hypothetical protein [Candidatus Villigracilis saccharophilus]|uniref:hypothetical protein n=1 Tax=Candidatus Villigracilis saccharophilus TaxID=3140684 RepID=UPI003135E74B|nr:hypothetical protein [Anaerolineales bacterium]
MVRSLHKNPARHKISLIIILLLMPAIQLGYTYYISWQVLSLILLFQFVGINTFLKKILPGLFLLLLMELSVFLLPINDVLRPFLNVGRQFILFFLLYLLINKIPRMADYYNKWVQRVIIAEVLLITVLVVLQFLGYPSRSMYYIPADYYIAGQNTLPDALDFRYSNVRPVGTFAEPSYLGFFMMSLYVVILTRFRENRLKWFLIVLSFVVILLAQTVAGLAAFFFISIIFWQPAAAGG